MAQIYLREALMAGKRLPYDAEVEYLESSGMQWIDTGVAFSGFYTFKLNARLTPTDIEKDLFGAYEATETNKMVCGCYQKFIFGFNPPGSRIASAKLGSSELDVDVVYAFSSTGRTLTVNGTAYSASGAYTNNRSITLFRGNNTNPTLLGVFKCYSFKIYDTDGTTLVRDFIPVRKGTVGYLYDRVSGALFGNAGTGAFVVGPDVVPVEWLQGDGSAYIVLPQSITVSKTTALSIECKYIADVSAINKCVFASYYGSRWYAIGRIQYNAAPVIIARFGNNGAYMRTTDLNEVYTTKIIPSQDKVIENGVEYSATFTAGLNHAVDAIGLFCAYNTNDKSIQAVNSSRLYWFNVLSVDGGSIVKNLIPIRVGSGSTWEGALLDTVNRKIYRNAGTGAFTYGNDLKYPIPAA